MVTSVITKALGVLPPSNAFYHKVASTPIDMHALFFFAKLRSAAASLPILRCVTPSSPISVTLQVSDVENLVRGLLSAEGCSQQEVVASSFVMEVLSQSLASLIIKSLSLPSFRKLSPDCFLNCSVFSKKLKSFD